MSFASCPAVAPTAPLAADTTTVSPAFGSMIPLTPNQAVTPGIPTTPRDVDSGTFAVSTLRTPVPSLLAKSCQPNGPNTLSPTAYPGCFVATTSPAAPPCITWFSAWGAV